MLGRLLLRKSLLNDMLSLENCAKLDVVAARAMNAERMNFFIFLNFLIVGELCLTTFMSENGRWLTISFKKINYAFGGLVWAKEEHPSPFAVQCLPLGNVCLSAVTVVVVLAATRAGVDGLT